MIRKTTSTQRVILSFLSTLCLLFIGSCKEEPELRSAIRDRIVVTNGTPFADLRILVDGNFQSEEQSLTFVNDQFEFLSRGSGLLSGNYSSGENNELILFQKGKAPTLISEVDWTEGEDIIEVTMREMIEIPVTFWVLESLPDEAVRAAVRSTNEHLEINRLGLQLVDVQIRDRTEIDEVEVLKKWTNFPEREMLDRIGYDAERLNVYVTEQLSINGRAVIGIWGAQTGTIAMNRPTFFQNQPWLFLHEIGHGLGLGHSENFGVPNNNVMRQGISRAVSARGFTAGQAFRAHLRPSGIVERFAPSGSIIFRNCRETNSSLICPDIDAEIFMQ